MSKTGAEILELVKALTKEVAELKVAINHINEENASASVNAERMYSALSAKFDMFMTLNPQTQEAIQPAAASNSRKPTRPAFFKKLFVEDRDTYLNTLYTQEEIDEAFQDKDVVVKKKEDDRISKVAAILYVKHIKGNMPEGRAKAFASIYDQQA